MPLVLLFANMKELVSIVAMTLMAIITSTIVSPEVFRMFLAVKACFMNIVGYIAYDCTLTTKFSANCRS